MDIFMGIISISIIIFIIIFGGTKLMPKSSKYSNLSYWSDFLIVIILVLMGYLAIVSTHTKQARNEGYDNVSIDSSLSIEEYTVKLDVDKDYNIKVTEDILVNFYDNTHHGIYRFIPDWLQYTNKEGKTDSRKAKLYGIEAVDKPYVIDVVNNKKRIKIGSANKTLNKGQYKYQIKFNYDMNGDIYEDYDEFIFHAFGDYWSSQIKKPTLIINMPDTVDKDNIRFFADKKREKDITNKVDFDVMGNTIIAKVKDDYSLYRALTVDILLPEGYFTSQEEVSGSYGYVSMIICIICILFTIVAFIIWLIKGKDYSSIEPVEFYPPNGLDPSEIGYIYRKDTGRKLTVATIVSLAAKGAIKIDEDKHGVITVIKNFDIDFDDAIKRIIVFKKVKDFDKNSDEYSDATKDFIKRCFPAQKSNEATVVSAASKALEDAKPLIDAGYIKVKSDTINDYSEEAIKVIKETIKEKNNMSSTLSKNERLVFDALFEKESTVKLKEHKTLYAMFYEVSKNADDKYGDLVNDVSSYKWTLLTGLWLIVCIALWGLAYMIIKDMNPRFDYLYKIAYGANVLSLFLMIFMRRRTLFGEELIGRIKGFRNYLETVEKDKLEKLVEENPNYFYDILPFAYVLNVTKKWIKKFEDIPLPERDMGTLNYRDSYSIDYISNNFYSSSGSSSGGCSSCGGGCSSCGGGCSSCGGGGGW